MRPQSIQRTKSNFNAQVNQNRSSVEMGSPTPAGGAAKPIKRGTSQQKMSASGSAGGGVTSPTSGKRSEKRKPPPPPPGGNAGSAVDSGSGAASPSRPPKQSSSRPQSSRMASPVAAKAQTATTTKAPEKPERAVFIGQNPLAYCLWGHYIAYGAAALALILSIFEISYHWAKPWKCEIDGEKINSVYIADSFGTCPTIFVNENGNTQQICCDETNENTQVTGNVYLGLFVLVSSLVTGLLNDATFGCSLWFPNDGLAYTHFVPGVGIYHFIVGIVCCASYTTCLAGWSYLAAAGAYFYGCRRQECGDGGYFEALDRAAAAKAKAEAASQSQSETVPYNPGEGAVKADGELGSLTELCTNITCASLLQNTYEFLYRAYNEDHLSTYFWLTFYGIMNVYFFFDTVGIWYRGIDEMHKGLENGTLDLQCGDELCKLNRLAIEFGPVSTAVPYAKGAGKCLNLNCSMILYPVTKILLSKLHSAGISFSRKVKSNSLFAKFFAHPISRYIPLQKNIEFHKLLGYLVLLFTAIHVLFHLVNLQLASTGTLHRVSLWGWDWTYLFTGAIITFAMVLMYASAVPDQVRRVKFEIFFNSHQLYMVFIGVLFIHGHVFWQWALLPCLLLCVEKYLEGQRGGVSFAVTKVEWIPPVMALYFKPKNPVSSSRL